MLCPLPRPRGIVTLSAEQPSHRLPPSHNKTPSASPDTGALLPELALLQRMQGVINSYYGMMTHATHFRLRRDIWRRHAGLLTGYMLPDGPQHASMHIKKCCMQDWVASQYLSVHAG
ncbi:hypothetical protein QMH89_004578 [Salmonella enterica]|nr:hypothetical protein [Salmonella enterica]